MDVMHGIKHEPELDLAEIEYIGVEPEDISNLLIKQENEYDCFDESNIKALEAKPLLQRSDSDNLTCKFCGKVLSTKQSLRGHLRIHSGQFYECDYIGCSRKFTRKADLKYHINTHTGKVLFKCSVCPKTYARKCLLSYHEKKHKKEPERLPLEQYSCENEIRSQTESGCTESNQKLECHEVLPSEDNLDKNFRKQSFTYGCNICTKSVKFSKKRHYDLHLITHTNEHQAKDPTVTNATSIESNFRKTPKRMFRIADVRINRLNYQCYCCRQAFHDKECLEEHMKVHTCVIICGWCDVKFQTRNSFQNHLPCNKSLQVSLKSKRNRYQSHSLICSHCSKKFASVYTFAAHQKLHTRKDFFDCTNREKQFHTKILTKQHELTHRLDRQWWCSFCGTRFKMNKTLKEHERIQCNLCKTKFTQSSSVWRNSKLVHEKAKADMKQ